jgi:signal transduction histidine kinase
LRERLRPSLRLTTALGLAIVAFVEVQALASTLQSQERLRDKVTRTIRVAIDSARPRLTQLMRPGGEAAWLAAIREARAAALASEVAALDLSGRVLAAEPAAPRPVDDSLTAVERDILADEGVVTVGPIMGESSRLVTYLGVRGVGQSVVLRLATPLPELVLDLRERRPLFIAHGVALTLLAVAAALLLLPGHAGLSTPAAATLAYEAAMARLHERSLRSQEELRRVEEELREKAALARSGELAAGIAHEMRNGIGTIQGYARLVERGGGEANDAARAIREECETLEAVIRRFMDFVKDERLLSARFDLTRTLRRVVARESRSRAGVAVTMRLPDSPVHYQGDEELLERAFENVVRNALEAAGESGHVTLELPRDRDDALVVTIADDGPGLPRELRENPRPFYSTKPRGLGLGLPLAVKIVRLHGGDLALSDRPPHGLLVTIRLPSLPEQDVTQSNVPPGAAAAPDDSAET